LAGRNDLHPGILRRLSVDEVGELFRAAGLWETQVIVRAFVDHFPNVDAVIAFSKSSSFGNHFAGLSEDEYRQLRAAMIQELESYRTPNGLE